ncbi:MAG: DUF2868 domain-containing protein [Burkholderiales bacterium]|nr:DUF2868 domain-containing protein [Burkholderiales bacterium]
MNFDEAAARRLVLVRAIESADEAGTVLSEAERTNAEQLTLQKRNVPRGERPDPEWYLPARAGEILAAIGKRDAGLARLAERGPGWERAAFVLPLLALIAGFGSEAIGDPHKLDLVSLPLLGFALWNVAVYLLLVASVLAQRPAGQRAERVLQWLGEPQSVRGQFRVLWWRVAGALEGARLQKVLHVSAAAWALGLVLWVAWLGISKEFRFGWQSTWLKERGVHWIVNVLSWPGETLFGLQGFSAADISRLKTGPAMVVVDGDAARWGLLYISFLVVVVIVPRALLAMAAAVRARRLARSLPLDLADPYFVRVMARVSPARVVVRVMAADAALREHLQCVVRQAAAPDKLVTPQGDELVFFSGEPEASEDADMAWVAVRNAGEVQAAVARLPDTLPVVVLYPPDGGLQAMVSGRSGACELLPLPACWPLDAPLRSTLARLVPSWKAAGAERLAQAWVQAHEALWRDGVQALDSVMAEAAGDSEKLEGWWPRGKAREEAMGLLLQRLRQRLDAAHTQLLRLHAVDGFLPGHRVEGGEAGWAALVNKGSAGAAGAVAGAAAGALAGAKIDLLTGGLTLGAAAAVGALLGGAGLFGAAHWGDWGGTVRFNEGQLASIAEGLVLQYLAVIHAGRVELPAAEIPAAWRSAAVAAVAADPEGFTRHMGESVARALRSIYPEMAGQAESSQFTIHGTP